eukprot:403355677
MERGLLATSTFAKSEVKKKLRVLLRDRRKTFIKLTVAGYWPLEFELDIKPIMNRLFQLGKFRMCLPIVEKQHEPLIFREWKPDDELVTRDLYKIKEPSDDKQLVQPDILLMPLIGFDKYCSRLGYGGGYYDRTIDKLINQQNFQILTIGVAFECQKICSEQYGCTDEERIYIQQYQPEHTDKTLDYVVTESQIYSKVESQESRKDKVNDLEVKVIV